MSKKEKITKLVRRNHKQGYIVLCTLYFMCKCYGCKRCMCNVQKFAFILKRFFLCVVNLLTVNKTLIYQYIGQPSNDGYYVIEHLFFQLFIYFLSNVRSRLHFFDARLRSQIISEPRLLLIPKYKSRPI
jgi:hypothetical protein